MTTPLSEKDTILAAEYALGVLQGKARSEFAGRLVNDKALAAAVRAWDEHFIQFADDIAPVEPPAFIATRLEQSLFPEADKPSIWNSLKFWRGLAIASLAGLLALGAWSLRPATQQAAATTMVAQLSTADGSFNLVAHFNAEIGELRLHRTNGVAQTGRSHELWLIAGKDAPVSLGVLPETAAGHFTVPENLRGKFKAGILAISDEPQGGSSTGAPTGAVLATSNLTEI